MAAQTSKDALIIGIDFGTTFSGAAAAYSASPDSADDINIIKTWPGGNNTTSDKVPSELVYGTGKNATTISSTTLRSQGAATGAFNFDDLKSSLVAGQNSGQDDQMRWGFQVRPNEQRLRYLKLLLDPGQKMPNYVSLSDIQQLLKASRKTATTAVADYLKTLYDHTKEILIRRYGEYFVKTTLLRIVLTVPAVWSDRAKDATLKAARAAGMGDNITLISEPEAAAVYTLQAIQPNHLMAGHNFVVIDAGGGTVDLITYSIKQLIPLRLEEVVRGSGGCCGAAFLNLRFQDWVRSKLGNTLFNNINITQPKTFHTAMKYFEDYVKRNFNPSSSDSFNVPFPGVPDQEEAGLEAGFLEMSPDDVFGIFKPVVEEVMSLVQGQLDELSDLGKAANGLILVGGFGQSECLLVCLRAQFGSAQLPVLQPINAWTAVVRGAVLRGLEGTELVLTRKSRRHYGVKHASRFIALTHPANSKYWDDNEEAWMARNRMTWYISKGQTVSSSRPVLFSFYRIFEEGDSRTTIDELVICEEDLAPTAYSRGRRSATKVVCTIVSNLQTVPKHLWKECINSKGKRYSHLDYKLSMQIESGGLRFNCQIDGVVYGETTATFA